MNIRDARKADEQACGRILYGAFKKQADQHNFPPDFPSRDLQALIGAATEFPGPGLLLPTRNHDVFEWCLNCNLKLVFQMTLMSTGLYHGEWQMRDFVLFDPSGVLWRVAQDIE